MSDWVNPGRLVFIGALILAIGSLWQFRQRPRWFGFGMFVAAVAVAFGSLWLVQEQAEESKEIVRLTRENAAKANENADLSKRITRLVEDTLATVTGGDSFAEVILGLFESDGRADVFVAHHGKVPLYDMSVRVGDIDLLESQPNDFGKQQVILRSPTFDVGNLAPGTGKSVGRVGKRTADTSTRLNIFFFARSGTWTQLYRRQRVGTEWGVATRIYRGTGDERKLIHERATGPALNDVKW